MADHQKLILEVCPSTVSPLNREKLFAVGMCTSMCDEHIWREKIKKMFNMASTDEKVDHRLLYLDIYQDYIKENYKNILYKVLEMVDYVELVKKLVEKYNVDIQDESILRRAVANGRLEVVKYLVKERKY